MRSEPSDPAADWVAVAPRSCDWGLTLRGGVLPLIGHGRALFSPAFPAVKHPARGSRSSPNRHPALRHDPRTHPRKATNPTNATNPAETGTHPQSRPASASDHTPARNFANASIEAAFRGPSTNAAYGNEKNRFPRTAGEFANGANPSRNRCFSSGVFASPSA